MVTFLTSVLYFVVLFNQSFTQLVESDLEVSFALSIQSLEKGVSYFMSKQASIASDDLFGIHIATGALLRTVEDCVRSPGSYIPASFVERLKVLCAKLNVLIPRIINIQKPANMTKEFQDFVGSEFNFFHSYRPLQIDGKLTKEHETLHGVGLMDFQRCLGELVKVHGSECRLSGQCWKVLQPKLAQGPSIPYQAMALVMLEASGCLNEVHKKWAPVTVDGLANDLCYSLYPHVSSFHDSGVVQEREKIESFLDAFFACSLLGFDDFLQVTQLRLHAIVQWQLSSGCFGVVNDENDEECVHHMSSATLGQLGLYLKWLSDPLENAAFSGKQPFKKPLWLTYFTIIILALIIMLLFIRKARRAVFGRLFRRI